MARSHPAVHGRHGTLRLFHYAQQCLRRVSFPTPASHNAPPTTVNPVPALPRSPGAYHPGELDRAGHRTLGDAPHAVVGTGPKLYDPVEHLPAAPWLGMAAARRVNLGVHSPGPAVYAPRDPRVGHVASPLLASGPKERFTGRHEPGRLQ